MFQNSSRALPGREVFSSAARSEREDATRIHGFTLQDLRGQPRFADIVDELVEFLAEDQLIAHNAPFDFGFLDAEFALLRRPRLDPSRMVDTLALAKSRFPGLPNSLAELPPARLQPWRRTPEAYSPPRHSPRLPYAPRRAQLGRPR